MTDKIKNGTARFLKKSHLNQLVKQFRQFGYTVERDGDTTKITAPCGDIVLMSIFTGTVEMARIDKSYFSE